MNAKTFYIKTYGCQMNVYDSEAIAGLLMEHDFVPASSEAEAQILLLNTCSVRDLAEQKVLGKAGILSKLKRSNPDLILGICGCMAQNMKEELFKKIPALDLICGPNDLLNLPKMVHDSLKGKKKILQVDNPLWVMTADIPKVRSAGITASISVMRGCNHACTFCIVPRVRGREVSRPAEDIIKEVRGMVQEGFTEVTLLGQNINSYGRDLRRGDGFPDLLIALNDIEGLKRIRFTTSHPVDIRDELLEAMSRLDKVCEALHFPLQSGSNRILQSMKRGYTRQQYVEKVRIARRAIPGVSISTDLIVGFPGETDEEFKETCSAMEELEFDAAYIFKYSERSGTPSALMENKIPEETKEERHRILLGLLDKICLRKNQTFIGKALEVLVEEVDRKNPKRLFGWSRDHRYINFDSGTSPGCNPGVQYPQYPPVIRATGGWRADPTGTAKARSSSFDGPLSLQGELVPVKIKSATAYALYGEIVSIHRDINVCAYATPPPPQTRRTGDFPSMK